MKEGFIVVCIKAFSGDYFLILLVLEENSLTDGGYFFTWVGVDAEFNPVF